MSDDIQMNYSLPYVRKARRTCEEGNFNVTVTVRAQAGPAAAKVALLVSAKW